MNKQKLTHLIGVCILSGSFIEEKIKNIKFLITTKKIKRIIYKNLPLISDLLDIVFGYYNDNERIKCMYDKCYRASSVFLLENNNTFCIGCVQLDLNGRFGINKLKKPNFENLYKPSDGLTDSEDE
jgi:hypothetical protein